MENIWWRKNRYDFSIGHTASRAFSFSLMNFFLPILSHSREVKRDSAPRVITGEQNVSNKNKNNFCLFKVTIVSFH